jgi:hypothetical protein
MGSRAAFRESLSSAQGVKQRRILSRFSVSFASMKINWLTYISPMLTPVLK